MNTLKRFTLIIFCLCTVLSVSSQSNKVLNTKEKPLPFFTENGNIAIHTEQMDALADTIAVINHREDDIVWSRIVYRVVDMREKQNNQLYYPVVPNNKYKSLFRLMLESHALEGVQAYNKKDGDIQPDYNSKFNKDSIPSTFVYCSWDETDTKVLKRKFITKNVMNDFVINDNIYSTYAQNQLKFLLQEVVFFNKHYSRMYSKIIGIAPIYFQTEYNVNMLNLGMQSNQGDGIWDAFKFSVLCWYFYDDLRPHLAKQYIIPNGNETQRLTFDDFFTQKLYHSYLLGDENMLDKMLLQTYNDHEAILREQKRIETELLNFEQDLWEY
jgi:gliding motility associated protien GldN